MNPTPPEQNQQPPVQTPQPQVVVVKEKSSPVVLIILGVVLALGLCVVGICAVGGLGLVGAGSVAKEMEKQAEAAKKPEASVVIKWKEAKGVRYDDPLATGEYRYVVLHLDIENRSSKSFSVNPMFGFKVEAGRVKYTPEPGTGLPDALELIELAPGGKTSGNIVVKSEKGFTGDTIALEAESPFGPNVLIEHVD